MPEKNDLIAVIMGGPSSEAEVSRNTGHAICKALQSLGYRAETVEYDPPHIIETLREMGAKVAFVALHGRLGEDGTIQGALELAGIPYTGSGVTSSAVTMDKIMSCHVFRSEGIRMADSRPYKLSQGIDEVAAEIRKHFTGPVVLKPACEGSTIGIEIVKDFAELEMALARAFSVEPRILAEKYLDGREFTVSVLEEKALPVIEIRPHSGMYDYFSKYTKGATEYIVPAPIPETLAGEMSAMAVRGYRAAECAGVVRFDFRTDAAGVPYLLEANSIPGMTETSLVPKAAAAAGMDFPRLCEIILQGAGVGKG